MPCIDQYFNQLLNDIANNQVTHLNFITLPPPNETNNVAPLHTWEGHISAVTALAVLHDGSLVSGGGGNSHLEEGDNTLRHWDTHSGQCTSVWKGHTHSVSSLAVLPDGSVVSGSYDKTIRRWDPQSGQCTSVWMGHTSEVTALAVLPDGSLVSGSYDKTLRHWDTHSGRCTSVWKGHTDLVEALAVLPDGSLVSGGQDNTIRHWDTHSGQCTSVWMGYTDSVYALAVLPDGSLVSGSYDGTLRHWDTHSGQCTSVWKGHTNTVTALAVLPGGSLVSGSNDNTLRHWDTHSGQCTSVWMGHTSSVRALAVLPDGSLVSGSNDNTLRHWPVPPKVLSLEQLERVLKALQNNRSVQSLALSGTTFTPAMRQALAQVIAKHPQLSSIALENCGFTEQGAQPLLNALKKPASRVTQFTVPHNPAPSQNVQNALQQAIKARPAALPKRKPKTGKPSAQLPAVPREPNPFMPQGPLANLGPSVQYPAPPLTKAQEKDIKTLLNNTLRHLDWSDKPLTQAQVLGLAGVLTMNHSLLTLSLEDAKIDTLGMQALAQGLKTHPRIQKLVFDENPLGRQGVQALLEVFQHHNTLFKVNAIAGTGATKAQRQQLKAYNKQYKVRKEQPSVPTGAPEKFLLPAHFYDRTWEGNQVMAEPVFSCALGKVMEKERLVKHGDPAALQQPVVALPLVKEHIRETVTETLPHAWHEGTVYLPQHWVLGVLQAIQAGEGNTLTAYWERHPGLVTHRYAVEGGPLPLYRLLMNAGRQGAFAQWLEYYNRYHNDDPLLPAIAIWFTQVTDGQHALHHLIQTIEGKAQERWFREVRFDLGVTGGVYHGLVHLHGPETLEADNGAIECLVAQGLLPTEPDKEGYTPLMRAVMKGHYALAELLLPYSETQAVDNADNTALHHLAKAKPTGARERCIVKLLSLGVDDNCPNQAGETPRALLGASKAEGSLGQYDAMVRAARINQGQYVKRLETTIALLLGKIEKSPEEENSAEPLLRAGLLAEVGSGNTYFATTQRLHQLFFNAGVPPGSAQLPPASNRLKPGTSRGSSALPRRHPAA